MARVVVLGAGGFIGSNMVAFLKKKGHWVRAVDIQFPEFRKELWGQADEQTECDLREYWEQDYYTVDVTQDVDWVFHFAANMGGVGIFHSDKDQPYSRDNMQIDLNVLSALQPEQRLFYSSSVCSYPTAFSTPPDNKPLKESDWGGGPADQLYGEEKRMMTLLCEKQPNARVAHFDTIFGPYQEYEGDRMKFPTAITRKVLEASQVTTYAGPWETAPYTGQAPVPIEIWGDGTQVRNLLYIDDLLEMVYEVMSADSYEGPVNIASKQPVTIQEVADALCKEAKITPNYVYRSDKPTGVLNRQTDTSEWDKRYTYRPKTPTLEGFSKLLGWLKTQIDTD